MMENWSKNQILQSELSKATCNNITIRIKSGGFVVFGNDYMSKPLFIDEYAFPRGFEISDIQTVFSSQYPEISLLGINLKIIYPVFAYSLVPNILFSEPDLSAYFLHALAYNEIENYDYSYASSQMPEVICVCAVAKNSIKKMKEISLSAELVPDVALALDVSFSHYLTHQTQRNNALYLFFTEGVVDQIIFSEKSLLLMNRFEYQTVESFIYYVLNSVTQSDVAIDSLEVILFGDIQKQSSIVLMLDKYFQKIHFFTPESIDATNQTAHVYLLETKV